MVSATSPAATMKPGRGQERVMEGGDQGGAVTGDARVRRRRHHGDQDGHADAAGRLAPVLNRAAARPVSAGEMVENDEDCSAMLHQAIDEPLQKARRADQPGAGGAGRW